MGATRVTLQHLRRIRVIVGAEADQTVRDITRAWVRAWDTLAPQLQRAITGLVEQAERDGRWPSRWEIARMPRLQQALDQAEETLTALSTNAGVTVVDGAGRVVPAAAEHQPLIITSQVPAPYRAAMLAAAAGRVLPDALDMVVARTSEQITTTLRPLSAEATETMRRELIRGIALGDNPNTVARRMLQRTEGGFNGGLTRAINVARTEMLDAYRNAAAVVDEANADVLDGWEWHSTLDDRSCASCWVMHGQVFPPEQPGPWDHPQGRCARLPVVKPLRDLGINMPDLPDTTINARARFNALPQDRQRQILGPRRLELLRTGRISWDELTRLKENTRWRPSWVPRTVRELETIARLRN